MKAADHSALTPTEQEELRRVLDAKRTQLLSKVRQRLQPGIDHDELPEPETERGPGDTADLAERATEDHERLALADHDRALLEEIDGALARMRAGTYGVSEVSGRPIPFERLRAVPWARCGAAEAERIERASRG